MSNYLNYLDVSNQYPNRITKTLQIENNDKMLLGWIQWHSAWRKYCFFPRATTIWDIGCLTEIQNKIKSLMDERKNGLQK